MALHHVAALVTRRLSTRPLIHQHLNGSNPSSTLGLLHQNLLKWDMIGAHERMEALKKMDSDFHYQVGRILLNAFHRKGSPDGNTKSIYERLHKQKLLPLTPDQEPLPDTITCMSLITVFASMRDLPALSTVESLLENGKYVLGHNSDHGSSVLLWNRLIASYLHCGLPDRAANALETMRAKGTIGDLYTKSIEVEVLFNNGKIHEAVKCLYDWCDTPSEHEKQRPQQQRQHKVTNHHKSNLQTKLQHDCHGYLIARLLVRRPTAKETRKAAVDVDIGGKEDDDIRRVGVWNIVDDPVRLGFEVYESFLRRFPLPPGSNVFSVTMGGCNRLCDFAKSASVFREALARNAPANVHLISSALVAYGNLRDSDMVNALFDDVANKRVDVTANVGFFANAIRAFALVKNYERVFEVLRLLSQQDLDLHVPFIYAVVAAILDKHARWDLLYALYEMVKIRKITATGSTWARFIRCAMATGRHNEALAIAKEAYALSQSSKQKLNDLTCYYIVLAFKNAGLPPPSLPVDVKAVGSVLELWTAEARAFE